MNKHIAHVSILASIIISSTLLVSAQRTPTTKPTVATTTATAPVSTTTPQPTPQRSLTSSTTQAILLAQIDLYNATVTKRSLLNYSFTFTLKSFDLINQDAYYRVMLLDKDKKTVYMQSFPNKVTVEAEKFNLVRDVLIAPSDLKGVYTVTIQVTNAGGLLLAGAIAGDITLDGTPSPISIKSCVIEGTSTKTTNDKIAGSCTIVGKVGKSTASTILYTTVYYGNNAAPLTQVKSRLTDNKAEFKIFALPNPGMYQLVSQLYDAGTPISSPVFTSIAVAGKSAKITNVITDKGVYKKDEVAKIAVALKTVNYGPGELLIKADVQTADKTSCGAYPNGVLKSPAAVSLSIPMTRKCSLPVVTVVISEKDGKVLDTYISEVVSTGEAPAWYTKITPLSAGVGALILAVLGLGFFVVRRIRARGNSV